MHHLGEADIGKDEISTIMNVLRRTPKEWTPLSYCKAKGKYGPTEEHGIYPEVRHSGIPHRCSARVVTTASLQLSRSSPACISLSYLMAALYKVMLATPRHGLQR